ncbi:hypothetical protein P154DRAFT_33650 [Amniculicola lignicola CBS 123094]|uniref:Uncharacterized protein n=1 Tax=Amniculicola lignicola CBS 123094 TaxID=1392246 RepID=A0A6A5WRS8_9PLEO|nr:hypothetical protein P154DRAFT_33650 [Amniculicola lignicola CBS 123094]
MNRLSEHFDRLSPGSLLLPTLLVTRSSQSVPQHLKVSLPARVCRNIRIHQDLVVYSPVETTPSTAVGSLHVVGDPSEPSTRSTRASTASPFLPSSLGTPSSWPAPLSSLAIRCVCPRTLQVFKVFMGAQPRGTLLLPIFRPSILKFAC